MSRGEMNKDVKYYCTGCQEKEQELADLRKLMGEYVDAVDNMYTDYDSWYIVHTRVKQACKLATADSKEDNNET